MCYTRAIDVNLNNKLSWISVKEIYEKLYFKSSIFWEVHLTFHLTRDPVYKLEDHDKKRT